MIQLHAQMYTLHVYLLNVYIYKLDSGINLNNVKDCI